MKAIKLGLLEHCCYSRTILTTNILKLDTFFNQGILCHVESNISFPTGWELLKSVE